MIQSQAHAMSAHQPQLVHGLHQLQREQVLPQIIAILEHDEHIVGVRIRIAPHQPQRRLRTAHKLTLVDRKLRQFIFRMQRNGDTASNRLIHGSKRLIHASQNVMHPQQQFIVWRLVLFALAHDGRHFFESVHHFALHVQLVRIRKAMHEEILRHQCETRIIGVARVNLRLEVPVQIMSDARHRTQCALHQEVRGETRVTRLEFNALHQLQQNMLDLSVGEFTHSLADDKMAHSIIGETPWRQQLKQFEWRIGQFPAIHVSICFATCTRVTPIDTA
mmetsp:Transcript_17178/g.26782  ORF Transcript_17178/g.26782 Transcript_17178/m.26782 type:complete len:276 (-) Transcript_17178:157-984(-)